MANGPEEYRDANVTTADRGSPTEWLRAIFEAVVLLFLLAWFSGWLGAEAAPFVQPIDGKGLVEPEHVTSGAKGTP